MMDARLMLTEDEQSTLRVIADRFPSLVEAFDGHITRLTTRVARVFQGVITTEEQADAVLGKLVERIVAEAAPRHRAPTNGDRLAGAMVSLITRHVVGQARDRVVQRLVAGRRN